MRLRNTPQRRDRRDYTEALRAAADLARETDGVRAIYMVGTVSQPGISDLDLLLCLDDGLSAPVLFEEKLPREVTTLVGQGTILKVPRRMMRQVHVIDDFPLRRVWGEDFDFQTYADPAYDVCRVMDWLPERLVTLRKLREQKAVDVLFALGLLKSITVSLQKLSTLRGGRSYGTFIRVVQDLRAGWWDNSRRTRDLTQLLQEAEAVALGALTDCNDYVLGQGLVEAVSIPKGARLVIPRGPRFTFGETAGMTKSGLVVPASFWPFYAAQVALSSGWLRRHLRGAVQGRLPRNGSERLSGELRVALEQRLSWVNEVGSWMVSVGIRRGLLKYGWFLD